MPIRRRFLVRGTTIRVSGGVVLACLLVVGGTTRARASDPSSDDFRGASVSSVVAGLAASSTASWTRASTTVELSPEWIELQAPGTATVAPIWRERSVRRAPSGGRGRERRAVIRLAYTGASFGIGSGRYAFDVPARLSAVLDARGGRIDRVTPHHGALAQGLAVLIADDRRVATLVEMLREGHVDCDQEGRAIALPTSRERVLSVVEPETAGSPPWFDALASGRPVRPYRVKMCRTLSGRTARLYVPETDPTPVRFDLESFSFRLALHVELSVGGRASSLEIVGVPANEPPKQLRLLSALVASEQTLFVDAGDFIDGASGIKDGALSAHRPLGLDVLESLGPAALVPGETELVRGARSFLEEVRPRRLPYVATNWRVEDSSLELPRVLSREVPTSEGIVDVAFLGIVDPRLRDVSIPLLGEGVIIEDPVVALESALQELHARPRPPDLIIVLSVAAPEVIERIRREVHGIDLVIGDAAEVSERVRKMSFDVKLDASLDRPIATALPILGIAAAELTLVARDGRWALRRVAVEPARVAEQMEPDASLLAGIARTRAELYPKLERPILEPSRSGPLAALDDGTWRKLVACAVLERSGADVSLLAALPSIERVPGPLTELMLANRLAMLDQLELHEIPGSRMLELLRAAGAVIETACGAEVGGRGDKIGGRAIDTERTYTVVTTDRTRISALQPLLGAAYSRRFLDARGHSPLTDAEGVPVSLRRAVLEVLRRMREDNGGAPVVTETLVSEDAWARGPLWLLKVSKLSTRLERFMGARDPAFNRVPETLATSPSSLTLTAELDAAIVYDSRAVLADLRVRGAYGRLSIERDGFVETQEPADDLGVSSSASLPGVSAPIGPVRVMPYTEVYLDSELTPVQDGGTRLPRQADLSFALGAGLVPSPVLRTLRVGGIVLRDLARAERPTQLGSRATLDVSWPFGPDLRLIVLGDAFLFLDTGADGPGDLRLKALVDTRLHLPLARDLDVAIFLKTFTFRGRVEETAHFGLSYSAGLALDLHGSFRL